MNDIWSMLGIEPTDDKKAIRKAFAAQSRLHHPEEEPEYFAALNQAYKAALEQGAGRNALPADPFIPDGTNAAKEGGASVPFGPHNEADNKDKDKEEQQGGEKKDSADSRISSGSTRAETEDNSAVNREGSLLERLDEAAEQAVKKSMETGALHDFIVLFENPKQAKQADTWKRFFLSEVFLREQFSEEFGKGLYAYLSEQTLCPNDELPMGLLQELAVAYAFIPHFAGEEYFDGLKYPKEWYKVSVENTFPGRRHAAEIFNMQGRACDLKSMTNRILRQPANKVRHNAFSDYLTMKEMNRDGRLTDREKEIWQQILKLCQPFYLYERNGKRPGSGAYESRSECVVKLYVQWLKDERLPEEVLLFFYKNLDFKTLEHSSTRGLYSALKEQVLRQCPQAEEILFGEDGKEQRITKLYRTYSAIINDNQNNYDRFIYGETPKIRERAKAFFALPEWEQLKGEKGLFERIYSASKRIVMPRTMAETLVKHLESGDFPEPERTELAESLLRSLATERMCRELDYRCEISSGSTDPEDIGGNPDFWQYFLMRGFGFRHTRVRGSWEEDYIYVMDGQCYLPAYINYIYAPSRVWQRCFTGFDEEKEEIGAPVSAVCPMPGGRKLRVEFHYHYCLYFVGDLRDDPGKDFAGEFLGDFGKDFAGEFLDDPGKDHADDFVGDPRRDPAGEVQVTAPVLAFSELREYAENLEKPEEFFFLLAVTAIEDSDRGDAQALAEDWLRRIPLHPFIVPTVARMLVADNDRIPIAVPDPEEENGGRPCRGSGERDGHMLWGDGTGQSVFGEEERHVSGNMKTAGSKITEAVLYGEQERFCFRVLVSEKGLSIWRQMDYGWQDIIFRSVELGWRKCGEFTWKEYGLFREGQTQAGENMPGSVREDGGGFPASGTDTPDGRKAAALSVLRGLRQPRPSLRAAYPLEGMDIGQKAAKILEAMGLSQKAEGYCVLRYGEKKEKRHDRVFYGAFAPFGFALKAHSMAHARSRDYLMSSSNRKIKEPKSLVGRFGWGFKYSPRSDYGPMYVYQGQSGTFYAYGSVRMHRADSLEGLLADFFREEWEGVTEAESYEGSLTVSRLDHRLEYCYTEEDMLRSMGNVEDTAADRFTLFGGYGMWMEFVRWMDKILKPGLPSWVNVIAVGLDWEKGGALTFAGIHEEDMEEKGNMEDIEDTGNMEDTGDIEDTGNMEDTEDIEDTGNMEDTGDTEYTENAQDTEDTESTKDIEDTEDTEDIENTEETKNTENTGNREETYLPKTPLLVWAKGMDRRDRAGFLSDAMQWYVDCGKFAENTGGRDIRILLNGF